MAGAEATIIKGGAMVASGGIMAELIIFNDPMYGTLALSGALVSSFGVIHEITENRSDHTAFTIVGELLKGFTLGIIAIPFWYLLLSGFGSTFVSKYLEMQESIKIEKSIWLLLSFWLSWFTVPIMNFLVDAARVFGKKIKRTVAKNDDE